jgi:hypothetical protein
MSKAKRLYTLMISTGHMVDLLGPAPPPFDRENMKRRIKLKHAGEFQKVERELEERRIDFITDLSH